MTSPAVKKAECQRRSTPWGAGTTYPQVQGRRILGRTGRCWRLLEWIGAQHGLDLRRRTLDRMMRLRSAIAISCLALTTQLYHALSFGLNQIFKNGLLSRLQQRGGNTPFFYFLNLHEEYAIQTFNPCERSASHQETMNFLRSSRNCDLSYA